MSALRHIAVIDIGKTNAKLALVDLDTLTEVSVVTRPNAVLAGPPWPHFDTEGHWVFLLSALRDMHAQHHIDAISVTTHGASVVLLENDGTLAAPILDYEHPIPEDVAAAYDALRPSFAETGSPRLSGGLNVGAQLHYQFAQDPTLLARTDQIIGYPQYWGHRLTGKTATDVTSIGCHTDLWEPYEGRLSTLAARLGVTDKMAPVRKSSDVLGTILPEIAAQTGLDITTPVACGIHDSNASLYPHLLTQDGPFSIVSTGTWVVVMTVGEGVTRLDANRDTLINVNALGDPVPSARFMGGREFEAIQGWHPFTTVQADVEHVLDSGLMLMPSVETGTGPFQGREMTWNGAEPAQGSGVRSVALSYYLALMTDTCLRLTDATGPVIVEGPFSQNQHYLDMLAAVTGRPVQRCHSATGTSVGAALLFAETEQGAKEEGGTTADPIHQMVNYARQWKIRVSKMNSE